MTKEIIMNNTREDRTKRVPLGTLRSKLTIPNDTYDKTRLVGRWVCDRAGRIQSALDGAYKFVEDPNMKVEVGEGQDGRNKMTTSICRTVGTHEDGTPMTAYLMTIRKDWYDKDQRDKQKEVDKVDEAIARGEVARQPDDKRYIGAQGIQYKP